jgi:hypothetical protein
MKRYENTTLLFILVLSFTTIFFGILNPFHKHSPKYLSLFTNTKYVSLTQELCGNSTNHTKDLFTGGSSKRLHHHIAAPLSQLLIESDKNLKETLFKPTLFIEDKAKNSYKIITASQGDFSLFTRLAFCTDVFFSSSEKDTVSGCAGDLTIDFSNSTPTFIVNGFTFQKETL